MADDGVYTEGSIATAHGSTGILQRLLDICTGGSRPGKDWTVEFSQNSKDSGNQDAYPGASPMPIEVILKNTGSSDSEEIYIGIREWQRTAVDYYGWDLNAYLTVPSTWNGNSVSHGLSSYDGTYEHWSELPILQLANTTMNYYLRSTKDFICLVMEISNDFYPIYLGNGYRLGSPGEFPFPLLCAGSSYGNTKYGSVNTWGPVRPSNGSFFFIDAGNSYRTKDGSGDDEPKIYPMQGSTNSDTISLSPDNKILLAPAFCVVSTQTLIQCRSIFAIRGPSLQSGQTYSQDGLNTKIFQQGVSTSAYNFMALEMVTTTTTTTHTTTSTTTT